MLNRVLCRTTLVISFFVGTFGLSSSAQTPNCLGANASDNPAAAEALNQGVEAYKAAQYSQAVGQFEKAATLAPCNTMARMYLATAEAQNVVPGLDTPENLKVAGQAIANFQIVLSQNPHDMNSMKQIAAVDFSTKKFDDAREWQKKVLIENPSDYEAAYTIGVIDWIQAHQNALAVLAAVGMQDDGVGNKQASVQSLAQIKKENSSLVAEALQYLTQAIADRPNYDDAMAYINLVYRRKADTDFDNPALRDEDIARATEWSRKAMQARKENEEKKESAQP
jgi:tetratricopeptide (TPR) repeat protein